MSSSAQSLDSGSEWRADGIESAPRDPDADPAASLNMNTYRRVVCLLCALLTLLATASLGAAEPDADDQARGKELAVEGFGAYKAGEYRDALQHFEQASSLYPTGQVWRMLGYTLLALERWVEAADALDQALATDLKPLPAELRAEVRTNLDRALSQVATVTIESDVVGAKVSIDGEPAEPLPVEGRRLLQGRHNFEVQAPGRQSQQRGVELPGGESTTVRLAFGGHDAVEPTAGGRFTESPTGRTSGWWPVGIAFGAVGLLATGVGVATLASGITMQDSLEDRIALHDAEYGTGCTSGDYGLCTYDIAGINRDAQRAESMQGWGLGLTIGGAALAVTGVVMAIVAADETDDPDAAMACGPYGPAGLGCAGRF